MLSPLATTLALLLTSGIRALEEPAGPAEPAAVEPMFDWHTIGRAEGLPSERVTAVAVDGERIWVGTEAGLVRIEGEKLTVFGTAEGLPFPVISALAVDPHSGDVWIGTLAGLARFSAGRIDAYTQLDSGLINDVVYGVATDHGEVWIATAAGLSHFVPRTGAWESFDVTNTLMHEPWCYSVTAAADKLYVAVWGGGVLVRDGKTGTFREHRDPDGEMEIDLYRDDGLIHDVTSSVSVAGELMWVGTYFGLSRYDGRLWSSYSEADSGLAADFINQVVAIEDGVWVATDDGLSLFDAHGWRTWRRSAKTGEQTVTLTGLEHDATDARTFTLESGPAGGRIFALAVDGEDLWVATDGGLSHAVARPGGSR